MVLIFNLNTEVHGFFHLISLEFSTGDNHCLSLLLLEEGRKKYKLACASMRDEVMMVLIKSLHKTKKTGTEVHILIVAAVIM